MARNRRSSTAIICITLFLTVLYLTEAYETVSLVPDETKVYVPAIHPRKMEIKFYPVSSRYLVLDLYRNPRINVTINSYSDFLNYPNIVPDSHFIPISDSGHGMTLYGKSAYKINDEIDKIIEQLPDNVREVTFYQYKDVNRYPDHNVFRGRYGISHLPPHQNFYRAT